MDADWVGHEFVVSAYPEEPYAASADARCGVWATFVVAGDGIETRRTR